MTTLIQRTLKKEVTIQGIGIHKGKRSSVRLKPASQNTGIRFTGKRGSVVALYSNIEDSESNTTISQDGFKVETVEHLLSCLYGLFLSNVEIEMRGREVPIGDGSARHFYDAITEAGIEDQEKSCRIGLAITHKTSLVEDNTYITIEPSDQLVIDCSLDWHPNIKGRYVYAHENGSYKDIAYARTFAEQKYASKLKKAGRSMGTKFGENCIDIGDKGSMEVNECVKHKVVDILGDISLLYGYEVLGKITAKNSGHRLHHKLIKEILNGDKQTRSH